MLKPPRLQRPIPTVVNFEDVLAILAPNDPASRRRELFAEFLTTKIEPMLIVTGEEFTKGKLALMAQKKMDGFKQDGVPLPTAQAYYEEFTAWRKAKVSKGRVEGGRRKDTAFA